MIVLDRVTSYFQSLSSVPQAAIFGALSLFLAFQAAKRYEDQSLIAFLLALAAIVLFWLAFAKAY
jgi:hypothetical protein